jgi:hypothetical protein
MRISCLKSGVDLQSSRFRERLDRRRHGSANLKLYSAVTADEVVSRKWWKFQKVA